MRILPRVSVVVPTRNRVRLLALTLYSILWQEEVDLEVLVIDDGSTDDVRGAVPQLADQRVRLFRQDPPHGVSRARNRGVAEAGGDWIAFVDDDDLWAPDKLAAQLRAAEQSSAGWAYTGAVNVTEDLRLLGGAPPADPDEVVRALPRTNLVPGGCSAVVVRRQILPSQPFDPSLGTFADWDLWIRLSRTARPAAVERPLVGYRVHGGNMSRDTQSILAELAVIEERYGGPVDRVRLYRHLARIALRGSDHRAAFRHYFRAAAADAEYWRGGFLPDLLEAAAGMGRRVRHRLERAVLGAASPRRGTRPGRRYAAHRTWVEQARPWIDRLRAHQASVSGSI